MTMIEKMARAMAVSDKMDCDEWDGLYQKRARAALQAMLEPSEGVVEAGNDWVITEDGRKVFTAMIRAALEEKVMDPYQLGYQHGKQGLQTDWRFIGNSAYSSGHTRGTLDALGYNPKKPWWWPF